MIGHGQVDKVVAFEHEVSEFESFHFRPIP